MSEIIMIVDSSDTPVNALERADAISRELWRRAAGGLIIDRTRKLVLCHERSHSKDERAGFWVATFGGKCHVGEEPVGTAARELNEEFGIVLPESEFHFHRKEVSTSRRQFEYLFSVIVDSQTCKISMDDGEVVNFCWLPAAVVVAKLNSDPTWFSYGYEVELITLQL